MGVAATVVLGSFAVGVFAGAGAGWWLAWRESAKDQRERDAQIVEAREPLTSQSEIELVAEIAAAVRAGGAA